MGKLRVWVRAPLLIGWTIACWLAFCASSCASALAPRLGSSLADGVVRAWARTTARILGLTVEVRGRPPEPPFFLVANHLSYVDIVVLYSLLPGTFLAKAEVASWPLLGLIVRSSGTLFVQRENKLDLGHVIEAVEKRLARGHGVIVFPEGTSTRGDRVLPFKPPLFEVAVRAGLPVSTASITYQTPAGSPTPDLAVCWWGDMSFLPHVAKLLALPAIRSVVSFGSRTIRASDRKTLAVRAQHAVEESFRPVAGSCA